MAGGGVGKGNVKAQVRSSNKNRSYREQQTKFESLCDASALTNQRNRREIIE
jgi:hypothetical protein